MESLGVGLDTFRALVALEQREIEPEDYELLSRLHANANTLKFTKAEVQLGMPVQRLRTNLDTNCAVRRARAPTALLKPLEAWLRLSVACPLAGAPIAY